MIFSESRKLIFFVFLSLGGIIMILSCSNKHSEQFGFHEVPYSALEKGSLGTGPETAKPLLIIANNNKEWASAIEQLKSKGAHLNYWQGNKEAFKIPTSYDEQMFKDNTVIGIFLGPSGGGDKLTITKLRKTDNYLEVQVIKEVPHPSCAVASVISYPYHIVKTSKVYLPLQLILKTTVGQPCE